MTLATRTKLERACERRGASSPDPIPVAWNLALTALGIATASTCLWIACHAGSVWIRLAAALVFSYVNNTLFSLLHESVHGVLHPDRRWNEALGRVLAAFFPTALGFQRVFHLGHHRRNRTEAEQFDYLRPGDNRFLKLAQWYAILTGLYWVFSPLGCLVYLISPRSFRSALVRGESGVAAQTSAEAMLSGFDERPSAVMRLEILLSIAVQAALFLALGLDWAGWLLCYAAFAVNWSSLQYADHAWSKLDVHDGAWNLRVNPVIRFLFLNYHHHRAHHQHPSVPWIHLPRHVDLAEERPTFLGIWLGMWRGPRPFPAERVPGTLRAPSNGALRGEAG